MKRWAPILYPGPGDTHRNIDLTGGVPNGSRPDARGYQQMMDEQVNLISGAGLTPSETDSQQLLRAVRRQSLNYVQAASVGGTANAITLAFSPAFASLADIAGTPLVFIAKAAITGAVTVQVDALTAKPLVWPDGTALATGDILLNEMVVARYNPASDNFVFLDSLSPTQARGLIRQAKSLTNVQQFSNGTRSVYSGITGATTIFSGSYTKVSPSSNVVYWLQVPTYVGGAAGPGLIRKTIGGVARVAPAANNDASTVKGVCAVNAIIAGLGAASHNWTVELLRADATAWGASVNPTSTDASYLLASGLTSALMIGEIEP